MNIKTPDKRHSRATSRMALGAVLSLTLIAPATLAQAAAALADDGETTVTVEAVADPAQMLVSEPEPEPEPEPAPAPEPAPEPTQAPEPESAPVEEPVAVPVVEEEPTVESAPQPEIGLEPPAEETTEAPEGTEEQEAPSAEAEVGPGATDEAATPAPTPTAAQLRPEVTALAAIPTRGLRGTVTDAAGVPQGGVTVYLNNKDVYEATVTAPDGTFFFDPVKVGAYELYASKTGLVPAFMMVKVVPGTGQQVVDPVLAIPSSVSGRVTDELTGDPIAGVTVFVSTMSASDGYSTMTAADGTWKVQGLAPGTVTVRFEPEDGSPYYTAWYSGAGSQSGATVISLSETGGQVTNINQTLNRAGRVDGVVQKLDIGGGTTPAIDAIVHVRDSEGSLVSQLRVTDPYGSFRTNGLRPGTYTIHAELGEQRSAEHTIVVGDTDLSGVTLFIDRPLHEPYPAPVPVDDSYSTPVDTLLQVDAPGVLANDIPSDPEESELILSEVTVQPEHGELIVQFDGSFVYLPDDGFTGVDAFAYTVVDASESERAATVTIRVGQPDPDEEDEDDDGSHDDGSDDGTDDSHNDGSDAGTDHDGTNGTGTNGGGADRTDGSPAGGDSLATTGSSGYQIGWAAALGAAFLAAGGLLFAGRARGRNQAQS